MGWILRLLERDCGFESVSIRSEQSNPLHWTFNPDIILYLMTKNRINLRLQQSLAELNNQQILTADYDCLANDLSRH